MGRRKAKPALPPVVVTVRDGKPYPSQAAAWGRLWEWLAQTPEPGQDADETATTRADGVRPSGGVDGEHDVGNPE